MDSHDPYLDGDPRPPDQRTPPNSPPPEEGGEPNEPGGAEDAVAQVATAAHAAFEVNEVWTMPRHPTYEHPLCRFMAFVHNRPFERYTKGSTFTKEQLLQIKPEHVHNWLAKLAVGKVDYSIEAGDRPTKMRCSSLEMRKKQLSFSMPNHAPQ